VIETNGRERVCVGIRDKVRNGVLRLQFVQPATHNDICMR